MDWRVQLLFHERLITCVATDLNNGSADTLNGMINEVGFTAVA